MPWPSNNIHLLFIFSSLIIVFFLSCFLLSHFISSSSLGNFDFTLVIVSILHHLNNPSQQRSLWKKSNNKLKLSTNNFSAKTFKTFKEMIKKKRDDLFSLLSIGNFRGNNYGGEGAPKFSLQLYLFKNNNKMS